MEEKHGRVLFRSLIAPIDITDMSNLVFTSSKLRPIQSIALKSNYISILIDLKQKLVYRV